MKNDLIYKMLEKMKADKVKSLSQLSHILNIPYDRLYKWSKHKSFPKADDYAIIQKWLNGKMEEIPDEVKDVATENNLQLNDNDSTETYLEKRRKIKSSNEPFLVPLIPIKAQAGYVRAIDQEVYIETLEKYALPPGVNPQGAIWMYWEIQGKSMEPEYKEGDLLLTSQVHPMDWENLRNFYAYVIVTDEMVLFKRVFCKNEVEWVLISENEEEYPQQLIPVEFIKQVWVVRRVIKTKLPPVKMFEIKV